MDSKRDCELDRILFESVTQTMLKELSITNIALIDRLRVCFEDGFNVLTGETGAGKSIVIGALSLLSGNRASPALIRSGDERATVEAIFDIPSSSGTWRVLSELGLEAEDGRIIMRRDIHLKGRSRCFINDTSVTLQAMASVLEHLLAIHGQHQQQVLLDVAHHLDLLDNFGLLIEDREKFGLCHDTLLERIQDLVQLKHREQRLFQRQDLLRYQLGEITRSDLQPDEEEELAREEKILSSSQRYLELLQMAYGQLYEHESSLLGGLAEVEHQIAALRQIDDRVGPLHEQYMNAMYQLRDVADVLRTTRDRVELDPHRLDIVIQRRDHIRTLKKKYGDSIKAILAYAARAREELDEVESFDILEETLKRHIATQWQLLKEAGLELSRKRRDAADDFSAMMMAELRELGMPAVKFEVRFMDVGHDFIPNTPELPLPWGRDGFETAEFMISANLGEPVKPVTEIASGGEISRIMLAVRRLIADLDDIPTLVFDEVDVGIGGNIARVLGQKLRTIAENRQILCITHLPQIASMALHHFLVSKREEDGRTTTHIVQLEGESRVVEIARMLDGEMASELSKVHAAHLLSVEEEDNT